MAWLDANRKCGCNFVATTKAPWLLKERESPLLFDASVGRVSITAVFLRLSKWLVVLALTLSLGAHWALLQSVAWVGMVVTYSQDSTFTEALSKTFDGRHPCKLCKAVQEGKRSEKKQDVIKVESKKEFCFNSSVSIPCPPSVLTLLSAANDSALSRTETPPVPPPRGFFV